MFITSTHPKLYRAKLPLHSELLPKEDKSSFDLLGRSKGWDCVVSGLYNFIGI